MACYRSHFASKQIFALHRFYSSKSASSPTPTPAPAPTKPSAPSLWNSPVVVFEPGSDKPVFRTRGLNKATAFFQSENTPKPAFMYSAASFYDHRINDHVPEVCVLGCSNAGKSTFVNALLGAPLARSSSTPGYTKLMNVFGCGAYVPKAKLAAWKAEYEAARKARGSTKPIPRLGAPRSLVLVDSPGYGFNSKAEWGAQIEKYLRQRRSLHGAVLLVRAEIALTAGDVHMLEMLARIGRPVAVVLTRADRCEEQHRGRSWVDVCAERVREVRACVDAVRGGSKESWMPQVYVSAAGMAGSVSTAKDEKARVRRIGEHAGMGGARVAVLRMAGILEGERVEEAAVKVTKSKAAEVKKEREVKVNEQTEEKKESMPKKPAAKEHMTKKATAHSDENISPANKALEEGESGHTGYSGTIVSWDDIPQK